MGDLPRICRVTRSSPSELGLTWHRWALCNSGIAYGVLGGYRRQELRAHIRAHSSIYRTAGNFGDYSGGSGVFASERVMRPTQREVLADHGTEFGPAEASGSRDAGWSRPRAWPTPPIGQAMSAVQTTRTLLILEKPFCLFKHRGGRRYA